VEGSATTPSSLDLPPASPTLRRTVFRVLETAKDHDTASRVVDVVLILLIAASVGAVILESMPSFERKYAESLAIFEGITVAAFSIEYLLRVWSSVERSAATRQQPILGRLRYMGSFHAIVDLLAILPFYLIMFSTFGSMDMRFLRAIRLLRVLKLTRYSTALNLLFVTFRENSKALLAAFLILLTVMLLAASGMYYFERDAQPEDFGSIPAAMWWAFATLTTVGYGDVTPITVGGKIFGALIAVVGIGMVALPTSILATGYSRQLKLNQTEYEDKAREAYDDGVLTDTEKRDLESLRLDLGLSKNTASQILDAGRVQQALQDLEVTAICPHCQQRLPA
jgi:voltage-gated potassium channel